MVIYIITVWVGLSALTLKDTTGFYAGVGLLQSAIIFILIGGFMVFVKSQYARLAGAFKQEGGNQRLPESEETN